MPRPKSYQRHDILQSCMSVFWRQGFAATSMRELELATGLSAGSLYHEFGSKEALFAEALEHYAVHVIETRIQHYLQRDHAVFTGIKEFMLSACQPHTADRINACLLVNTAAELGQTKSNIGAIVKAGFRRIDRAIQAALKHAQDIGELAKDTQVATFASQLAVTLPGLILAARNGSSPQYLATVVDAVLHSQTWLTTDQHYQENKND
ncbi:MAG: TetR/AcrR family transcriptional regulator [Oleiphilaceae bacterium]|nr:TetR/AcrR family transcriptional regulator [Oleiphilaceae bacterium]